MDILQFLAADKEILLYRKELNNITKRVTATILLQQMIYWHSKMGGPFYKFIEPCKNEAYKEGDSWCEELGFSPKEFATAYKTLEDLKIVSKKINMNRVTYYHIDTEMIRKLLNGVYVNQLSAFTQTPFGDLDITKTTTETTSKIINTPQTPRTERQEGDKKPENKKTPTLADLADQKCLTILMVEDFVEFRLNTGGINNEIAFKKHVMRELSQPLSDESVNLEEWISTMENHRNVIDYLNREFLSIPAHIFSRKICFERAKDDFTLMQNDIKPTTMTIEIAFQKAEAQRRERIGGVA